MFISNTDITDSSSPARIFTIEKLSCSPQIMFMLSFCVLAWCATHHLAINHHVSSVSAARLPVATELQLGTLQIMSDVTKPKNLVMTQIRRDNLRNKTRVCIGDAFETWRRLQRHTALSCTCWYGGGYAGSRPTTGNPCEVDSGKGGGEEKQLSSVFWTWAAVPFLNTWCQSYILQL